MVALGEALGLGETMASVFASGITEALGSGDGVCDAMAPKGLEVARMPCVTPFASVTATRKGDGVTLGELLGDELGDPLGPLVVVPVLVPVLVPVEVPLVPVVVPLVVPVVPDVVLPVNVLGGN
jgi:hypothetical protein